MRRVLLCLWVLSVMLFVLGITFHGPWWLVCGTGLIAYGPIFARLGRRE